MCESIGDAETGLQLEPPSVDVVGVFSCSELRLALAMDSHLQQLAVLCVSLSIWLVSRRNDPGTDVIGGVDGEVDGVEHGGVADAEDVRQREETVAESRFHDGAVGEDRAQHQIDQTSNVVDVVAVGHQ